MAMGTRSKSSLASLGAHRGGGKRLALSAKSTGTTTDSEILSGGISFLSALSQIVETKDPFSAYIQGNDSLIGAGWGDS